MMIEKKITREVEIAAAQHLKERDYWLEKLSGELIISKFPQENVDREPFPSTLNQISLSWERELFSNLMERSKHKDQALHVILLSGLIILISKYTGNADVIVGTPIYKQSASGKFINTALAIRSLVDFNGSFKELLLQVRKNLLEALDNQAYPLEVMAELLGMSGADQESPFFTTALLLDNIHDRRYLDHLGLDMIFSFSRKDNHLELRVEYNSSLYSTDYINVLVTHFACILNQTLTNSDKRMVDIEILSHEEKQQLLEEFNNNSTDYPKEKSLSRLFTEQVERIPDRLALIGRVHSIDEDISLKDVMHLSYYMLNQKANNLACSIKENGCSSDSIIGVIVERSIEMLVGILGILKAGGAYLPIDPEFPLDRIRFMLNDCNAKLLLTDNMSVKSELTTEKELTSLAILDLIQLINQSSNNQGTTERRAEGFKPENLNTPIQSSADLAYIIYTSGTTGKPKGNLVVQYNVSRVVLDSNYIDIFSTDRLLQVSNYAFDGSVFDIYGALLNGASLVLLSKEEVLSGNGLSEIIKKQAISVFFVTTALFNVLIDESIESLTYIRKIIFGGERASVDHCRKALSYFGPGYLINAYGPTETTVFATCYLLDHIFHQQMTIPIGRPISNTNIFVLDKNMRPVPLWVLGEMFIGGSGVCRGYLNSPELTSEKFISCALKSSIDLNPEFNSSLSIQRGVKNRNVFYKTGDLGRWTPGGIIEFLGRIDHQVKIRGFRIELGEIENQILTHPAIKEAIVIVVETQKGNKNLAAYLGVGNLSLVESVTEEDIKEFLSTSLPEFMVPNFITIMEKLPLASTGKIDRKALPKPYLDTGKSFTAPRNSTESGLVQLFAELLNVPVDQIGIDTHFFKAGGHSLKATQLIAKIQKIFGVNVSLINVFKNPTVRELAGYVSEGDTTNYEFIKVGKLREYYPLSSAQKRIFILNRMETEGTNYNIPMAYFIESEIDINHLEEAIHSLINRHESLRTSFHVVNDEPVQRIHTELRFELGRSNANFGSSDLLNNTSLLEDTINRFVQPFDLGKAPLLRVELTNLTDNRFIFLVDMHHIISDGVSLDIFIQELLTFYDGGILPPLEFQYKDYALWQQEEAYKKEVQSQERFWLSEFKGELPVLNLPLDFTRPPVQSFSGNTIYFNFGKDEATALNQVANEAKVTPFMVFFAAISILLMKLSGQEDVIIGTPVAGRKYAQLEGIIGMFVNTLAIRSYPSGNKRVSEFLTELKSNILDTFENQEYPFEELVTHLAPDRDAGRNPLFDVVFSFQNMDIEEIYQNNLELNGLELKNTTSKFDLLLTLKEKTDGIMIIWEYCTNLFNEETVRQFNIYFTQVVRSILENPKCQIGDINIVTEKEKQTILTNFNNTNVEYPRNNTISELFNEQVNKSPDRIALIGRKNSLEKNGEKETRRQLYYISYKQLDQQSCLLAQLLTEKGIQADSIVAIMLSRSIEMIVGVLGIVKAGGAYLPIASDYPEERKEVMLADSGAVMLISDFNSHRQSISTPFPLLPSHSRDFMYITPCGQESIKTNSTQITENQQSNHCKWNSLAYIIYTSGSTGIPKGVMVTQRNVVRLVKNCNYVDFNPGDYILQTGALEFDASTFEIWGALLNGIGLCLESKERLLDPVILKQIIVDYCVSIMWMTSPWFNQMVQEDLEIFSGLQALLVGGDALSTHHINRVKKHFPHLKLINGYGPTENTTFSTTFSILHSYETSIPIGKAISNSTAYIVSKTGQLQPVRVMGELLVGGDGISRGYLNSPELTSEKFLTFYPKSFYSRNMPNHRHNLYEWYDKCPENSVLYRTGDLARWLLEGNIEFLGRIDHQVKIRGFRVELGEIETQLLTHPQIKEAFIRVIELQEGNKSLAAYLTLRHNTSSNIVTDDGVKDYLSERLPDYMIPLYFCFMEKLPLASTGKINTKELPLPKVNLSKTTIPPRNKVEMKLAELFSELLGISTGQIGIDTHFFKAGGHSLKATQLISKIHKSLNVAISLGEVFSHPTIKELSRYINESTRKQYSSLEPEEKKEYYPISAIQKRFYLVHQMEGIGLAYNIAQVFTVIGKLNPEKLKHAFHSLLQRHESLRTSFEVVNGQLVQRIHDHIQLDIVQDKITNNGIDIKNAIMSHIRPFDLSEAPLLRVGLLEVEKQGYLLIIDVHHIVADGTSLRILYSDLLSLYDDRELPKLTVHYKDFSQWQMSPAQKASIKKQGKYWTKRFEKKQPETDIFTDFIRPEKQSFKGGRIDFQLEKDVVEKINLLRQEMDTTLYIVLLAVYTLLLSKYSGQEDIIVGCAVAGRQHDDLKNLMGLFINALPLRNFPLNNLTFSQYLENVKNDTLNAFENQGYPFDYLLEELEIEVNLKRNPLFDVELILINMEKPVLATSEFELRPYEFGEMDATQMDIALYAEEIEGIIVFSLYYSADLFMRSSMERFVEYFKEIVKIVLADKNMLLRDVHLSYDLNDIKDDIYSDMESNLDF